MLIFSKKKKSWREGWKNHCCIEFVIYNTYIIHIAREHCSNNKHCKLQLRNIEIEQYFQFCWWGPETIHGISSDECFFSVSALRKNSAVTSPRVRKEWGRGPGGGGGRKRYGATNVKMRWVSAAELVTCALSFVALSAELSAPRAFRSLSAAPPFPPLLPSHR